MSHHDIPAGFGHHIIKNEGRAMLTSRILLHADYTVAQLPAEEIDFEDPARALPLLVAIKPTGPCVLSVATRPAYGDGTVSQWLDFMMSHEGYEHGPITRTQIGIYPAVTCDARQVADGIVMQMRFALLEDGGRMLILNGMAPVEFWSVVEPQMMTMLNSFEFQTDHGTKVALFPGEEPPAGAPATAPVAPAQAAEESPSTAASTPGAASDASSVPTARLTAEEFAQLVLAGDATSFDQDVGINATFRDNGVGLVPRVLSVDSEEKSARLGAGAIEAIFRLPFGWYATDDGRRTLVFDGENRIQISMNLRAWDGTALTDYARELVAPYLEKEPGLPLAVLEFEGRIVGAGVQGATIDGEKLDQVFLVRAAGRAGYAIVARVTATGDDTRRALNLAGDILATLETAGDLVAQK